MNRAGDPYSGGGEPASPRRGVVMEFDERRGIGVITDPDGTRHGFHCTAIVEGSRTIAVGTPVGYSLREGPLGREEATAIVPV